MSEAIWAPRVVSATKKEYYFSGEYAGFISKSKGDASFCFTESQAKELGNVMLKFLEYVVDGKLTNSPVKRKK